jgi:hypothetical protein
VQDKRGLFYYPVLQNRKLRMYVRPVTGEIEFRMWDDEDPSLWHEHGWVPWPAIQQAAELYENEGRNGRPPLQLYDLEIAKRLIKDAPTAGSA